MGWLLLQAVEDDAPPVVVTGLVIATLLLISFVVLRWIFRMEAGRVDQVAESLAGSTVFRDVFLYVEPEAVEDAADGLPSAMSVYRARHTTFGPYVKCTLAGHQAYVFNTEVAQAHAAVASFDGRPVLVMELDSGMGHVVMTATFVSFFADGHGGTPTDLIDGTESLPEATCAVHRIERGPQEFVDTMARVRAVLEEHPLLLRFDLRPDCLVLVGNDSADLEHLDALGKLAIRLADVLSREPSGGGSKRAAATPAPLARLSRRR